MSLSFWSRRVFLAAGILLLAGPAAHAQGDPLPSWNKGPAKSAIIDFVERVTTPASTAYVPPEERIATFDNDGTLWTEQPNYVQAMFLFDRIRALAPQHPEWRTQEPFKSVLAGDTAALADGGIKALNQLLMATHAGMTMEEFDATVIEWLKSARHPRFDRAYNDLIFQPMVELLSYLRANGFKTYIVSGGGIAFMRPWVGKAYGIPPEQVIGSSIKLAYEIRDGKPVLRRLPELEFIDDAAGKPVGIARLIGRRPIFAAGNSDGDLEMLQWTTLADGLRFGMLVHHTDGEREYAYDRQSHVGKLDKALDEASARGWTVVDMKRDWKVIYPEPR